ncbi:MAG: oxygen-independent coproporphyrinogen III oxidase [Beijerinckiaceae bacterium]|jgi:oxygen-independent coproporphyrinogen-3 oxidase|nr:oxygen-independent coproporphyrinogen III oxidase [Beijerinckiaceae bacterium]
MSLSPEAILRNAEQPVPRYTSYPTAPHFHAGVGPDVYRGWLQALPENAALSLYVHVPFCDTLCWFCGCHTKITRQYAPIADYLEATMREIATIAALVPASARVTHLHWGGGSPTILSPDDSRRLVDRIRREFRVDDDMEFAVEVDPRGMDDARIDALAESGLTRVSIGVQDFDPAVQKAINRVQSVAETRAVIERFREHGVGSLNIDAIYGLPGQHAQQLSHTLDEVVRLAPDRIALFGYAHVPWMKRHQSMIDTGALPGVLERHAQAELAAGLLEEAGFARIGIDHFARLDDELAVAAREGRLQRNFQGYTVDPADALIGLGASAIGKLPQGYVQNEPAIAGYARATQAGGLAAVRGVALSAEDQMRGEVIERLMCDLAFSRRHLRQRYGSAADPLIAEAEEIIEADADGFVVGTDDGFMITSRGRPFLRTVAARFDAYLPGRPNGHSLAV